jgi:hypothetical protein
MVVRFASAGGTAKVAGLDACRLSSSWFRSLVPVGRAVNAAVVRRAAESESRAVIILFSTGYAWSLWAPPSWRLWAQSPLFPWSLAAVSNS